MIRWDFRSLLEILNKEPIVIDLSDYNFFEPIFLIWILSLYGSEKVNITWLDKCDDSIKNYLERCGFLSFIDNYKNKISINKIYSEHLIEITKVNENIDTKEWIINIDVIVTKFFQSLWLNQSTINDLYKTFYWIIRELIYNVIIHSNASFLKNGCFYMMQCYPAKWILQFSLVDNWVWIKKSFEWSKYYDKDLPNKFFIDLAFQKWVTRDKELWAWNWLYWTEEIIKASNSSLTLHTWDTIYNLNWLNKEYNEAPYWQWLLLDIKFNMNNINSDLIDYLMSKWVLNKGIDVEELEHLEDLF